MRKVQRRELLVAAASASLSPPSPGFAQSKRVPRVGWLGRRSPAGETGASIPLEGLRAGLRERGWIEGDNLVLELRSGDFGSAHQLATELVQSRIELLVAEGGMVFRVREAVGSTPLVFYINGDPVEAGLVASYARPGGNMTGTTALSGELSGKRVELLRETLPNMVKFAAIANQGHPGWRVEYEATQAAAKKLGLQVNWLPVLTQSDFGPAFEVVGKSGVQGIIAVPDNLVLGQAKAFADFTARHSVPAVSGYAEFTSAGNLLSYGPLLRDAYARLAHYVDRLLKGAKPGDLPVENPTKFELVVNMKTANACGLKFPRSIVARADRIID